MGFEFMNATSALSFPCGQSKEACTPPEDWAATAPKAEEKTGAIFEALKNAKDEEGKQEIKAKIELLDPIELKVFLECASHKAAKAAHQTDPWQALEGLAELLTLEEIENAAKCQGQDVQGAMACAKEMLAEANYYIGQLPKEGMNPGIRESIKDALASLLHALDTLLAGFGLSDLFAPSDNDMHANLKVQKIVMLITLLSTLAALLVAVIGESLIAGMVTLALFGLLVAMAVIYAKFLKPAPTQLPNGTNLTELAEKGKLAAVEGRDKFMDKLASSLIQSRKTKRHPLVLGPNKVGKTEAVKGFARLVQEGKYPALKGKTVFYFTVSDLSGSSEGLWCDSEKKLQRIKEELGRHKEEAVLVLDGIHQAFPEGEEPLLANRLKPFLENGPEGFPYVIAITTEDEFKNRILPKGKDFTGLFKKLKMESATKDETLEVLYKHLIREFPQVIFEKTPEEQPGVLEYLFDQAKEHFPGEPNPCISLTLLRACLEKMGDRQKGPMEELLGEKKQQLELLSLKSSFGNLKQGKKKIGPIKALEEEIVLLEGKLQQEKEALDALFKTQNALAEAKTRLYRTVVKVKGEGIKTDCKEEHERALKTEFAVQKFLLPALEEQVRKLGKEQLVNVVLSKELIDLAVQDELNGLIA